MSNFVLKPSCQVSWDCQDPCVKELEAKTTHGQLTLFMIFTMFIKWSSHAQYQLLPNVHHGPSRGHKGGNTGLGCFTLFGIVGARGSGVAGVLSSDMRLSVGQSIDRSFGGH